ncbi:LLGL2 [Popillia japonica]|uniref:LLGL2 n=1 Tax=Popillia japonica TaxID=7064 RepID=A0AAW1JV06_POPJA
MFKFIKAKGPHQTAERQKLQKELFSYRRTLQHGFPHKPTAIAWDPTLRLICIGTATGAIKVFGRPGVEFYGQHQSNVAVTQLVFLPHVGKVVSLCDDNSLHLWEVDLSSLVEIKTQALEGKLKKISAMCVESEGNHLLLGTEGGNIYLLDLNTFTMTPDIIYQDVVMQNVPQDYKLNPGAVEAIFEQPGHPNNILIGYNRGLIVLWDRSENTTVKTFASTQQLESLCWHEDGESFTSSHNDGSYMSWQINGDDENGEDNEPTTTYGPFPCKAIPKIIRKELNGEPLIVFSGGLPRASYGDKHTVSVIHNNQHVTFDLTSKVIDFIIVESNGSEDAEEIEYGTPAALPDSLLILADEELVAIDLQSEDWKMMNLPYLVSLHASAVICSQHVSNVPQELWEQLKDAGKAQTSHLYSNRAWPIDGGQLLCSKGSLPRRELLLTGHEDGTVRFWDAGSVNLTPIYKFSTAQYFTGDEFADEVVASPDDSEDEWPPFRKTGIFDPYSDDARLAVKKISLCPLSGTLAVAGTAGHVVIAKFDTEVLDGEINVSIMNIVSDRDGFVWKGHDQLSPKTGSIHQTRGFQANSILQLYPPAAVTCVVLRPDWGLLAAGTAHGLALFDYIRQKPVIVKCTLNPSDLTGAGDAPISRRKSFKKSLRESFRRLRKGRSTRRTTTNQNSPTSNTPSTKTSPAPRSSPADENFSPLEAKPVERQIEARAVDDAMGSIVRCLYFARTFLINVQNTIPTLWAGTNNGTVYVFTISIPSKRDTDDVICQLGKEIQLKHRAPVISIAVLDGASKPLPEPLEVERAIVGLPDPTQPHRVIIASEEQFKIFTLPSLKPYCKYKLTAHEGARVRRMSFANFTCAVPDSTTTSHAEVDLLCLTNLGDCLVLSIPDLKRQLNAAAVRREDINGISSLVFTRDGEALYFHSSSELQRISLSATKITSARCYLQLPEGARHEETADVTLTTEEERPAEEQSPSVAMVNGNSESKESSVADKTEEVRENGDDALHNVTVSSSIGDITIDSVKDHLGSGCFAQHHLGSGEELTSRLSGIATITKTVTTVTTNESGEVVTTNSTTTTATNEQQQVIESTTMGSTRHTEIKRIQVSDILLKAPLALAEELDSDCPANGGA